MAVWARTDTANRQTAFGGLTLTYDANGNLVSDGATSYSWDARDRLMALMGPAAASFQYDPLGRRRAKTIGGTPTTFAYDGLNPIQELTPTGITQLLTGLGIDESLTRTPPGANPLTYLTDALGSTLALAGPGGALSTEYTYEPFGRATQTGGDVNPFQYTGRENDGTGLYYYRARYYHPGLQRFVSEDRLRGPRNPYAYARNNALRYVDPRGEAEIKAFGQSMDRASMQRHVLRAIRSECERSERWVDYSVRSLVCVGCRVLELKRQRSAWGSREE